MCLLLAFVLGPACCSGERNSSLATWGSYWIVSGEAFPARPGCRSQLIFLASAPRSSGQRCGTTCSRWTAEVKQCRLPPTGAPARSGLHQESLRTTRTATWLSFGGLLLWAALLPSRGGPSAALGAAAPCPPAFAGAAAGAGERGDPDAGDTGAGDNGDLALINSAFDLARARAPEPFLFRGHRLAAHMRMKKELRRLERVQLPTHVTQRIDEVNTFHAVRASDIIVMSSKKAAVARGKGQYRVWACPYMLLSTFGHFLQRVPTTSSSRSFASRTPGKKAISAAHVQSVRDAVADRFLELQRRALHQLLRAQSPADLPVVEISLDETSMKLRFKLPKAQQAGRRKGRKGRKRRQFIRGTCHVMMLHGKLLLGPALHDIVVPPAVLADTTTRCLLNAVLARLPMTIED